MAEPWATVAVGALVVWIVLGLVSVGFLWYLWRSERAYRKRHGMPPAFLTLPLAVGGTITCGAATWAAFLTIRTLLGLGRIEWSPLVTVPLLLLALSLPIAFAAVVLYQRFRY